jgi:hypothetical protein
MQLMLDSLPGLKAGEGINIKWLVVTLRPRSLLRHAPPADAAGPFGARASEQNPAAGIAAGLWAEWPQTHSKT